VFVVGLGTLVVPFDSSVNVAFPHIIRGLDLPIPAIQWVVIAYTLTYAALTLVFGRVGDMVGYRRIFMLGCAISAGAFLLCAAAPGYYALLGARAAQGLGAALALSCGPALATSLYPESERTRVLGLYTMAFGIGGALGPALAGQLVEWFGWRAVFWFRAPISLLAFALAWGLPRSPRQPAARFDALGAVLLTLAIAAMLLAVNQVRANPGLAAAAALGAAALGAGFVVRQGRTDQPIMRLHYFREGDFALANGAQVALNLAAFSVMLLVPFYLDRFGGLSIPGTGLTLAASPLGIALAAPVAGRLASRVAPKRLALAGAAAVCAAQWVIGSTGEAPVLALLWLAMLAQGMGMGLFQVAYMDIATATIPRADRGVAGSLVMVTRTIGVVTAASSLMLIFHTLRTAAEAGGAPASQAFLDGFHAAFRVASVLPALVVAAALAKGWWRR
jgi:MFS family permease